MPAGCNRPSSVPLHQLVVVVGEQRGHHGAAAEAAPVHGIPCGDGGGGLRELDEHLAQARNRRRVRGARPRDVDLGGEGGGEGSGGLAWVGACMENKVWGVSQ